MSQNSSWHSLWDLRGTQAPRLRQSNNTLGGDKLVDAVVPCPGVLQRSSKTYFMADFFNRRLFWLWFRHPLHEHRCYGMKHSLVFMPLNLSNWDQIIMINNTWAHSLGTVMQIFSLCSSFWHRIQAVAKREPLLRGINKFTAVIQPSHFCMKPSIRQLSTQMLKYEDGLLSVGQC